MAKLLLIVGSVLGLWLSPVTPRGLAQTADYQAPPATLIGPKQARPAPKPAEHARTRPPVDDRCRPLKEQLETELQRSGTARRAFQARVAHNAGSRLCREGHPERGMAEFQRGLSYLQEGPHY